MMKSIRKYYTLLLPPKIQVLIYTYLYWLPELSVIKPIVVYHSPLTARQYLRRTSTYHFARTPFHVYSKTWSSLHLSKWVSNT